MAGQTLKQLPQYMHCFFDHFDRLLASDAVAGRMAPVGHEAMSVGTSQDLR